MADTNINSAAFQSAELQSERLPIFGVFGFLVLLIVVMAVRIFVVHTTNETVVRKFRDYAPKDTLANLYQAAVQFSDGTKQQDDVTAVIIKRTGTRDV